MTRLPVSQVEGPGNQANWDEIAQKSLLPSIGDLRLVPDSSRPVDGWLTANGDPINAISNREASLVIGTHLANVPAPAGFRYIQRVK